MRALEHPRPGFWFEGFELSPRSGWEHKDFHPAEILGWDPGLGWSEALRAEPQERVVKTFGSPRSGRQIWSAPA
jgi:hypothetical protein